MIRQIDSELPVQRFETMEQVLDDSVAQRRFQINLILVFALTALVLASLGIYGVVSYSVAGGTNEMGIRMAVGACGSDLLAMILRQAVRPVAIGVFGGLVVSLVVDRLLTGLLYGVVSTDAVTFGSVMILPVVAVLAGIVPARRASRVDPVTALHWE